MEPNGNKYTRKQIFFHNSTIHFSLLTPTALVFIAVLLGQSFNGHIVFFMVAAAFIILLETKGLYNQFAKFPSLMITVILFGPFVIEDLENIKRLSVSYPGKIYKLTKK